MKKIYKYVFLFSLASLVFSGCYKDMGNYKYKTINTLSIKLVSEITERIPLKDSTVIEMEPTITQTSVTDESNLKFEWQLYNSSYLTWDSYSKVKKLKYAIVAGDKNLNYNLRLVVTDSLNNVKYYKELKVNLIQPYAKCWFVLQDNNGKSVLGSVENPDAVPIITVDAFGRENPGSAIDGSPRYIMTNANYVSMNKNWVKWPFASLYVFTDKGGAFYNSATLEPNLMFTKFMRGYSGTPNVQGACYSFDKEFILDNGNLWQGRGVRFYKAVLNGTAVGTTASFTGIVPILNDIILFDDLNKRFLYFNQDNNIWYAQDNAPDRPSVENKTNIENIPVISGYLNVFNPTNVGADKTFLFGGVAYGKRGVEMKGLAILWSDTDAKKLHLYEFSKYGMNYSQEPSCSGYWAITPTGISKNSKFATSFQYDRIVFYSSENKLYKLDLSTTPATASVIYTYPDAGATIKLLKFRSDYYNTNDRTPCQWLALAVQTSSGQGAVVEMHLSLAGQLDKSQAVHEYNGFGKIVDIGFTNK